MAPDLVQLLVIQQRLLNKNLCFFVIQVAKASLHGLN